MTDTVESRLDLLLAGQARLDGRFREIRRAQLDVEEILTMKAQEIADAIRANTERLTSVHESVLTAFQTLLQKVQEAVSSGDLSAVEAELPKLQSQVDSLAADVLRNTPAEPETPASI